MKRRLPPLPTLNDILRLYQIRAKKQLSQNFILDPRILTKFVKMASVKNKSVVEVGPGPGGITRSLIEAGAKDIIVIEKDPRFIPSLDLLAVASGNILTIKIGDCMRFNVENYFTMDLSKSWEDESPNIVMMGNLPFNVSTPLLIRLLNSMQLRNNIFSYGRVPLLFTFQHEVAHRLVAPPGDPERSRISIFAQNFASVEYLYTLSGRAFVPPPDVDVGIVKLIPLIKPYIDLPFNFIEKVVTTLMNGKKKRIENTAAKLFPKVMSKQLTMDLLDIASIEPNALPFQLKMDDFEKLCFAYKFIVDKNPEIQNYIHRQLKSSLLTQYHEPKEDVSTRNFVFNFPN